jgi:hypothetical protein
MLWRYTRGVLCKYIREEARLRARVLTAASCPRRRSAAVLTRNANRAWFVKTWLALRAQLRRLC